MGSVGIGEQDATKALAETLGTADPGLRPFILESLAARGGENAAATLVRFLGEPGKTGQFAARAVASAGERAPRLLARVIDKGTSTQFRAAVEVLVGMKGKPVVELLAKALFETREMDATSFAAATIKAHLDGMDSTAREFLTKRALALLDGNRKRPPSDSALAGALKFVGFLKRPRHAKLLLKNCRRGRPAEVRRAALTGLAQLKPGTLPASDLGKVLLPMLGENDFTNVVKPTLDVLWQNPLPGEYRPRLAGFLGSPYEPVKRYAVRELGRSGSAREVKDLLACLESNDRELAERASGELRRMESAVPLLVKKLDSARDFDSARKYANILLSHKEHLTGSRIRKLAARMIQLMARNDERARAYLWLVRSTEPRLAVERLVDAGRAARRTRKYDASERYLRLLLAGDEPPGIARFELVVTLLRRKGGKGHVMSKSARDKDDALSEMAKLVASHALDVPRLLDRERSLKAEDLFYVGFHFAERIGPERAFGGQVLSLVASGRGRLAKNARDKLVTEGMLERGARVTRPVDPRPKLAVKKPAAKKKTAARKKTKRPVKKKK